MLSIIQKIKSWRLNFFDLVVLTGIILILGTFLWLRFSKKTEWISLRLVIANDDWWWEGQAPQWWYADDLEVGQVAYSSFGEKVAEVIDVESFDIGGYRRRAFIDLNLKGTYDTKRKLYLYNFQPLQIGKPLDLTFGKHNVRGLVTYIENGEIIYKEKSIEVKMLKVKPWVAESYFQGLQMKDSRGRVLAQIKEVMIEQAKYYQFSDLRGQMMQVTDPDYRDVTIKLTIKTFESGGREYFVDRAAIKTGEEIWFQFPQAVIRSAQITKILK